MSVLIINATHAAGVALVAVGAGAQWGWPVGLMVGGGLVLALSLVMLRVLR